MLKRKYIKYIVRFMAGFLLVVAALFGWLEYKRSSELKALVEMGFPVTPEAMLEYYPNVPDDENAWVLLEGLVEKIKIPEGEEDNLPIMGNVKWDADEGPMTPEMLRATEATLQFNAESLATLHDAVRRPYLRVAGTLREDGNLNTEKEFIVSPAMRAYARIFVLEGYSALYKNDLALASKDIDSVLHLARLQQQYPSGISALGQYGLLAMAIELIPPLLQSDSTSDDLLAGIMQALKEQESHLSLIQHFSLDLANWLLGYYDNQPMYSFKLTDLINFNNLFFVDDIWDPITAIPETSQYVLYVRYSNIFSRYAFLENFSTMPMDAKMACKKASIAANAQLDYFTSMPMTASTDLGIIDLHFWKLSELRFWQVAVNLKRFNLKYGRYPAALAELQPEFFDTLPVAPVEDTEWEYTLDADGCILHYSISTSFRVQNMDISLPKL